MPQVDMFHLSDSEPIDLCSYTLMICAEKEILILQFSVRLDQGSNHDLPHSKGAR